MGNSAVTLAERALHNPNEPRHFMRLKPVENMIQIVLDGSVLAESKDALRLLEVGRDFYDPALYLPRADVVATLGQNEKSTHCPLKGDAVYFDLTDDQGMVIEPEIAWAYPRPFDFAAELAGRIAFYGNRVTVIEGTK